MQCTELGIIEVLRIFGFHIPVDSAEKSIHCFRRIAKTLLIRIIYEHTKPFFQHIFTTKFQTVPKEDMGCSHFAGCNFPSNFEGLSLPICNSVSSFLGILTNAISSSASFEMFTN